MQGVERAASVGAAPRFALVEPAGARLATRLAALDLRPTTAATELGRLDPLSVAAAEVLVVVCTERLLLTPGFQRDAEQTARLTPRVAVLIAPGPEAAAYAARLGWHGFVPIGSPTGAIVRTIAAVARGELAFPQSATTALVRALARVAPVNAPSRAASLTPRQHQIVALIAEGATDAQIATQLQISRSTAHKHVQNARRRLQAKTRGQLVAVTRGLEPEADRLTAIPAWRPT
jgi:DNA-binding NarL/FixJ family response regulator